MRRSRCPSANHEKKLSIVCSRNAKQYMDLCYLSCIITSRAGNASLAVYSIYADLQIVGFCWTRCVLVS